MRALISAFLLAPAIALAQAAEAPPAEPSTAEAAPPAQEPPPPPPPLPALSVRREQQQSQLLKKWWRRTDGEPAFTPGEFVAIWQDDSSSKPSAPADAARCQPNAGLARPAAAPAPVFEPTRLGHTLDQFTGAGCRLLPVRPDRLSCRRPPCRGRCRR